MSGKKVKAGEFYNYAPGGIVKIIRIENQKVFGILFKHPNIIYNFPIDADQLSTKITDPDQKRALDNRTISHFPIQPPPSDINLDPDGF